MSARASERTKRDPTSTWWPAAVAASLLLPGTAVVEKYFGLAGTSAYLLLGAGGLWVAGRHLIPAFLARVPGRTTRWLAGLTLAGAIAFVLVAYPLANSGRLGGGSDRDEALDIAAKALLSGEYPYDERTYFDNPISPMPGAILLAAPFVVLGGSAYQNLFWLVAFFFVIRRQWVDERHALLIAWAGLLSPAVAHALATGGDTLANALYVFVAASWLLMSVTAGNRRAWWLPAIFLGLALSSRANFLLLLPLIVTHVRARAGRRKAGLILATMLGSFALVTLPFVFVDPAGFTPAGTAGELAIFNTVLPRADVLIPLGMAVLGLVLAIRETDDGSTRNLWRLSAIVQAFPVAVGLVLTSLALGRPGFFFAEFGVFFLFFGLAGWWPWAPEGLPAAVDGVGREP